MDSDAEILMRVSRIEKFLESLLYNDSLVDWKLAKDLGELLVRIDTQEIMGHIVLARACRHIGDHDRSRVELQKCRELVAGQQLTELQRELFLPILSEEEEQLTNRE